ncbi:ECM331 [Candida oxycetoniae]|uniref:ECM331 n=1 Tax=Candida oxycetoniae TaxID=497107 RepID=A0AAI9WYE1_9ASCO|nr:ECM331 [Candida oxycetoniae]KAI3405196.2 ECM331 [Candida oxycetoniae]
MHFKSLIALIVSTTTVLVQAADNDTDSCSFSKTSIIDPTGIQSLNACPTLDGDITITGNSLNSIDLSGVTVIKGKVLITNSGSIISLNLNQLQNITGSLVLNNVTQLNSIDLNSLSIADDLELISLPSFAILNLNQDVSKAGKVVLSDTALSNLNGLAAFDTIDHMNINNNKNITHIEFVNLQTVTDSLVLSFNNDNAIVYLNALKWASNLTIQDVGEFYASNLTAVNGSLSFSYNTFDKLNVSKLETVGSSLQIFANDDLTDLSLNSLREISGELRMFNNTQLENLDDSFNSLQRIRGAVSIAGPITNFTVSSLQRVNGDFELNSSSEDFDCSEFNALHDAGDIEGHNYICAAGVEESMLSSQSTSTSSSDSTDGSGSTTTSTGNRENGVNKLIVPGSFLTGLVGVLALL